MRASPITRMSSVDPDQRVLSGLYCRGNEKLCFLFNRITSLVAMATYSSHRLIMGKEENDNFFCLIGDILNFFYRNVY